MVLFMTNINGDGFSVGFRDGSLDAEYFGGGDCWFRISIPIGKFSGFERTRKQALGELARKIAESNIEFDDRLVAFAMDGVCNPLSPVEHGLLYERVAEIYKKSRN